MERLTERTEYVHVSLRIPVSSKENLEKEAEHLHMNFNSLVSKILERYTSFDKIAEDVDAIPLDARLFLEMLQYVPMEQLQRLGEELGTRLVRQTFTFLDLECDIYGLVRRYFEIMSSFSGWYSFAQVGSGTDRKLVFEHQFGPKWGVFLKAYISTIIKTATGVEHRITADDSLVTVYC